MSPAVAALSKEERTAAFRAAVPDCRAPYHGCVVPGSWLARRIDAIRNPRCQQWNSYFRACRRIPAGTPCHGMTSWKRINDRRCELIQWMYEQEKGKKKACRESAEFKALQAVAGELGCGPTVASNFCMGRWLRRAKAAGFAK